MTRPFNPFRALLTAVFEWLTGRAKPTPETEPTPEWPAIERSITRIVVHCTATPEGRDVSAAEIDRWHRDRGWSGIGYHKVIRLDGKVELGRDPDNDQNVEEHVGAHAYGHNRDTLAVVYVGGVDAALRPKDTRTPAQIGALLSVADEWRRRFSLPVEAVVGHYELDSGKACPSFDMEAFRADLEVIG